MLATATRLVNCGRMRRMTLNADLDCPNCNTLAHVELIGVCYCCDAGTHDEDDDPDLGLHDNAIDEWWADGE